MDSGNVQTKKRKKIVFDKPNELFVKWLEEWYVEAATKGSKIQYAFGKALVSLKRYPLPLKSGKECLILEHFGPSICVKLDRRLAEYKKEHPERFPSEAQDIVEVIDPSDYLPSKKSPKKSSPLKNVNKSPKKSSYVPAKNSPAFAILVAMHENDIDSSISDEQLQIVVRRLLNKSYPESCIDNLIKKNLLVENKNSDVFRLTEEGKNVAQIVYAKYVLNRNKRKFGSQNSVSSNSQINSDSQCSNRSEEIVSYNSRLTDFDLIPLGSCNSKVCEEVIDLDCEPKEDGPLETNSKVHKLKTSSQNNEFSSLKNNANSDQSADCLTESTNSQSSTKLQNSNQCSQNSQNSEETICMLPNTFEIILVVDNHETGARFTVQTETVEELIKLNVKHIVRSLKIGDFAWIARDTFNNELVLPYVVERKRMDDFAQSIKDSRFQEQKFRLKKSGLKNLIYLVENYGSNMFLGLPLSSVLQAATNTEVIDGFTVKFTQSHADSMVYLQQMTTFLETMYVGKTLLSVTEKDDVSQDFTEDVLSLLKFKQFNLSSNKARNYKVSEMFVKQLVQLHGLSVAKAMVIVEKYPTPLSLINAFHEHGQNLLADLKYSQLGSRIGNVLSNCLYQFYTRQTFT